MNKTLFRIKENLLLLDMESTYNNIERYLKKAKIEKMTILETLDLIFEQEAQARKKSIINHKIKMSGIQKGKTFETYDLAFSQTLNLKKIESLKTLQFIDNKENVIIMGSSGVGKTHLASALAVEAIKNKYTVLFVNFTRLLKTLILANHDGNVEEKLRLYSKYRLLVIDEIGYLSTTVEGADLFYQLINMRYEKCATIITTNRPLSMWQDIFKDPTLTLGILDHLKHHCITIKIEGDSYRLKGNKNN